MQEILLKMKYFERGFSKSLKKGNFISFEPSLFQWTILSNYQFHESPQPFRFCKDYVAGKLFKYGFLFFELNTETQRVNFLIQSKYGKTRTRKNSIFKQFSHRASQSWFSHKYFILTLL